MEIIGQRVRHKTLGSGKITSLSDSRVVVMFDSRPTESTFIFPDAFSSHLSFQDSALQNQVKALLAAKNKSPEKSVTKPAGVPTDKAGNKVTSRVPIEAVKDQPRSRINTFSGTTIPSSAILLATAS